MDTSAAKRKVYLFGKFQVEGTSGLLDIPPGQLQILFTYLILLPNTPHPRERIANLLWPDADPTRSGRNLSNLLYRLKQILGPAWLETDTETLTLRTSPDLWVDIHTFETLAATASAETLQQAAELYQGDLLPALYDDWILPFRERLRETYLTALFKLAHLAETANQPETALAHYRQLLTTNPLREDAARGQMRCLALLGRFPDALVVFATLEYALQTEIGVQPGLETRLLADRLRNEWELTQRAAAYPAPAQFVGRVTERARLLALLDRARAGQGGLVVVLGEPGIGKTRLLEELAHAAGWRGWQIAWGHGDEFHLPAPYSPLAQALTEALPPVRMEQLARLIPEISLAITATFLPNLSKPALPLTTVTPAQIPHALQTVLHGLQSISPHLFLLDDMQWADPILWSVLDALRPELQQMSTLLVLSARHTELQTQPAWELIQSWDRAGVPILHLSGFGVDELREVSQSYPLSAVQLEQLHRATGGNPFFALNLLKTKSFETHLETPPTLAELALEQLASLSAPAQYALQIASVIGSEFDYQTWEAVLARENLLPASLPTLVGEIERAGLLHPDRAGYRFAHDILRAALYHRLPVQTRQQLHAQVLAELIQNALAHTLDLLYHARQAEIWPQVARYGLQMGEQSLARFNYAAAVDYFSQALDTFSDGETSDRVRALLGRIRANEILGNREAQRDDLATLHPLTERLENRQPDALLAQARYFWQTGDFPQAIETASRGLALTEHAHPELQTALLELLGQTARDQGNYPQARAWFEQALLIHQTFGNPSGEASILDLLGIVAQRQGNLAEAIEKETRALALYREVGDVYKQGHVLGNLGVAYWMSGDYARARQMFEQALEISQQLGEQRAESAHLSNLAALSGISGDFETALARYDLNLRRLQEAGDRAMYANTLGNRAYTLFELRKFDEALAAADDALARNRELGRRRGEGFVQHTRGLTLTELGRFAEAQDVFEASLSIRQALGERDTLSDTYCSLSLLHLKQGALSLAEQAFDAAQTTRTDQTNAEYRRNFHYTGYLLCEARGETTAALTHLIEAEDAMHAMARELPEPDQPRFLNAVATNRQIQQALATHAHRVKVRLVRAEVPLGKKLTEEDYISVTWTLEKPGDDRITPESARRQHILRRLLTESAAQGVAPTDDDLAQALGVSRRTILRDMQVLREQGVEIKTRQRSFKNELMKG